MYLHDCPKLLMGRLCFVVSIGSVCITVPLGLPTVPKPRSLPSLFCSKGFAPTFAPPFLVRHITVPSFAFGPADPRLDENTACACISESQSVFETKCLVNGTIAHLKTFHIKVSISWIFSNRYRIIILLHLRVLAFLY